jgi:formate dehydrogenase subunit beta
MNKGYFLTSCGSADDGARGLLRACLEKGILQAVLLPLQSGRTYNYVLVRDPALLAQANVPAPVMPVQGARALMNAVRHGGGMKIGAVMRMCEIRAAIELCKLEQAHLKDVSFISLDCRGVTPVEDHFAGTNGTVREACRICDQFTLNEDNPVTGVDLHLATMGVGESTTLLVPVGKKGMDILDRLGIEPVEDTSGWSKEVQRVRGERRKTRQESLEKLRNEITGVENISKVFDRCIQCHACRNVCPICHCRVCFAGKDPTGDTRSDYLGRAGMLGGICCVPEQLLFHLGRMSHMSLSCVSCGTCEDVCPVDIPVGRIFSMVGQSTQEIFGYMPGRNTDEELPSTKFELQELQQVED